MTLPAHPEQFDKPWLASRIAPDAGRLNGFTFAPVGTGQVADSFRITLEWVNPDQMPKSLIAKCPALDPASRTSGKSMSLYSREVHWYQNMAQEAGIRVPHCYYAEIHENQTDFVLLLEDAAPAKQIDQMAGCSTEQVALAISELAKLHAFRWNDLGLKDIDWLSPGQGNTEFVEAFLPKVYPEWRARYEGRLDPEILDLGAAFVARLKDYYRSRSNNLPVTVLHNDFRLDNMLFVDADGRPVIVDWQTIGPGNPMTDVAYCISTSFRDSQERARCEKDLLRLYLDRLNLADPASYRFEQAWQEYRFAAFVGMIMAIVSAMLVERTERGDEMFAVMAERSGYQALMLNSLAAMGSSSALRGT